MKSNVPIRPEASIEIAWGLSHLHSENKESQIYGGYIRDYYDKIRNDVKSSESKDEKSIQYLDNLRIAIDSCVRTLGIIIRGRNLNFEENDKLRGQKIDEINALSKSIMNYQGLIPRIQATMIGGVSALVILKGVLEPLFPDISKITIEYFILLCAGLGYVFAEVAILPYLRRKVLCEMIRNDRDRNIYFQNYVMMSRIVLKRLLSEAVDIYNCCYEENYPKIEKNKIEELLDKILPGPITCENISRCKVGEEITDKNWVICETIVGFKNCENYRKYKRIK